MLAIRKKAPSPANAGPSVSIPVRTEPIVSRALRFALVGFGRVAARHVDAMDAVDPAHARWVAVCDVDPGARERARALNVPSFESYDTMLDEVRPDVVVLATPSGVHPRQAIRAARAGVHVVTEKPMATRWSDAQRMVREAEDADVLLFVVKQQRFSPLVRALKHAIDQQRFGRIYAAQLNVLWTRPQAYYDLAPWRGTWELDGGALMNQAIHYIDLLQWLLGPVESVHAFIATLARNIEVEDTATLNLRWRSGALGSATVTMLAAPTNYEAAVTVIGERGLVRLGGVACNELATWRFDTPHPDDDELPELAMQHDCLYGGGHLPLYQNIVATLRGEAAADVDGSEGLKSLEVVVAAYRSAQEGRRISLPLEL